MTGGVQGVGFRPFVYRLAEELSLTGWIRNTPAGVTIEVQGEEPSVGLFPSRLESRLPPAAFISSLEWDSIPLQNETAFRIMPSGAGPATAVMMPDMATCSDCLEEIFDPGNRRYLYPFTNCTNCGPRFSIIESLPYDRGSTSMAGFTMCPECRREYEDVGDRRFHAQPNACPVCGPVVTLKDASGSVVSIEGEALDEACGSILDGKILAVKGLGGFHLFARADRDETVAELRRRKNRRFKPLAVMIPSTEILDAGADTVSVLESPASPIVLVDKKDSLRTGLSRLISPGSSTFGLMLPYTPLHHVMMRRMGIPVVATSGNRASEPICTSCGEALERLSGIADLFLDHDRPILRPVDDSVVAVSSEGVTPFRRSRGYAPLPVLLPGMPGGTVCRGANERNTAAVTTKDSVVISQHLGDMSDAGCLETARRAVQDICRIYAVEPVRETVDLHPDYDVRVLLERQPVEVQHHYAHALSCMVENRLRPPVLGIVWDGSGYGPDGTVWGGEFILVEEGGEWRRLSHFRRFPLPGGEQAVRFPGRTAAGMLYEAGLRDPSLVPFMDLQQAENLFSMMAAGLNSPATSSAGRLFDGISAMLGVCSENTYSGQAAIELQSIAELDGNSYPVLVNGGTIDWVPVFLEMMNEKRSGVGAALTAGRFHLWLSEVAVRIAEMAGLGEVVLSGGCFQNTLLLDLTARRLREAGFEVFSQHVVPPGDGGLSLGQAAAVMYGGR